MKEFPKSFRESIHQIAEEIRQESPNHPAAERLIDYHLGELTPGAEYEKLQDHLAICAECGEFLDDLRGAAEVVVPGELRSSLEQRAEVWHRVRSTLDDAPTPMVKLQQGETRRQWLFRSHRLAYAAAAFFLVTSVVATLGRLDISEPRVDARPFNLVSRGQLHQRAGVADEQILVPTEVSTVLLSLLLDRPEQFEAYRAEIFDSAGKSLWSHGAITPDDQGFLYISLPRNFLPEGHFRIQIQGLRGEEAYESESYEFELIYD